MSPVRRARGERSARRANPGRVHRTGNVARHVKSGNLRALAVTTARTQALPDIPTLSEFIPGRGEPVGRAPKDTPSAIIEKLNVEINAALADPKMKARFADLGGMVLPARRTTSASSFGMRPRNGPGDPRRQHQGGMILRRQRPHRRTGVARSNASARSFTLTKNRDPTAPGPTSIDYPGTGWPTRCARSARNQRSRNSGSLGSILSAHRSW